MQGQHSLRVNNTHGPSGCGIIISQTLTHMRAHEGFIARMQPDVGEVVSVALHVVRPRAGIAIPAAAHRGLPVAEYRRGGALKVLQH